MARKTVKTPVFWLDSIAIVVTAEFHNPSILNPDFLKSLGIVPSDWIVKDTITTPAISTVNFDNGIHWQAEPGKLQVSQICNSAFRGSYEVSDIVNAYVEKLPHVPYRQLGLNWHGTMLRRNPEKWLVDRFLKSGPWMLREPKVVQIVPKFLFVAGDANCSITLTPTMAQHAARQDKPAVGFQANFHHGKLSKVDAIQKAISNLSQRQEYLLEVLTKLLRSKSK